jgi:MHS family alpha-ketoglutarate permease-like MFS transporter
VRPIGGWVFGRLADRRGRRFSTLAFVLLMCGGSLIIAVLPTQASVGVLAPVLLTVARLAQGLSVGGEYRTSATYMREVAVAGRRGFHACCQYVTLIGGERMRAWAWRIPCVTGAAAAVVALFLRRPLHETQSAEKAGRRVMRLSSGALGTLMIVPRLSLLAPVGSTVADALFGGTAEHVGLWFTSVGLESGFFVLPLVTAWAMPGTRSESHPARGYGMASR